MSIKKIIIDNSTQAKELDANTIQLDLVAYPYNESNQKEPDAEFRIFINNQLLQNLNSDMQGNIKENLIIRGNHEKIIIKLQDTKSGTISDIKEMFLKGNKEEKKETNNDSEKTKVIVQLKLGNRNNIPERAKNDPDIVNFALKEGLMGLDDVSEKFRGDKEMVRTYLDVNGPHAFLYISDELKTDEEFVMECIKKYGTIIINYLSYYMLSRPNIKYEITNILDELNLKKEILKKILDALPADHENRVFLNYSMISYLGNEIFKIEQMYERKNTYRLKSVDSLRAINQAHTIIENQK